MKKIGLLVAAAFLINSAKSEEIVVEEELLYGSSIVVAKVERHGSGVKVDLESSAKTIFGNDAKNGVSDVYIIKIIRDGVSDKLEEVVVPRPPQGLAEGVNSPFQLVDSVLSEEALAYAYRSQGGIFVTVASRKQAGGEFKFSRTRRLAQGAQWEVGKLKALDDGEFSIATKGVGNEERHFRVSSKEIIQTAEPQVSSE